MGIFRHPKTLQEMKANEILKGEDAVCAKFRDRWLPNVYDDIFVFRQDRSWKNFRKTKWKSA